MMIKIFLTIMILYLTGCSSVEKQNYEKKEVMSAVASNNVQILNRFIKKGFDINQTFDNGETLLGIAVKQNSLQTLSELLDNNIQVNKKLEMKEVIGTSIVLPERTAIFYVNSLDSLRMLIASGANTNEIDGNGESLLNYFIKNKPERFAIELIQNNVNIYIVDETKWYPIFWAVNVQNFSLVRELLRKDKNQYRLKDEKLNYPIYYANSEEIILELLEFDYNVNEKNIYGENILGEVYLKAKQLGYSQVVKVLLEKGVNPRYKSYKN